MSLFRWALFSVAVVLLAGQVFADNLTTIHGKKLTGKLAGVDAQGVTLATETAKVKVAAKDILIVDLGHSITPAAKDARYHELELTDGSTFRIGKFSIKGKKVETDLLPGPKGVALPTYQIEMASVFAIMRNAEDPKSRDAWKKLLTNRGKRDLYVIREAGGLNFVQGTIVSGNAAGDLLTFEKEDGGTTELRLSRATGGLVFAQQPPSQIAPTLCKVVDVFGNVLIAKSLEITTSGVVVTTVNDVVVRYQSANAIAKLDYSQGNIAYLSDLEAQVEAPEVPADEKGLRLNVAAPFVRDTNIAGEPIKLGAETYPKGLSVSPDTRLTYNLGGDYREFKALVGIQENTLDANLTAQLTIETESGLVLFSEMLRRKDAPRAVALDIKGVKQLRIVISAEQPVLGNRVILAECRVQK